MKVFSIGFTKTSAERFFTRLALAGAVRVLDVRLHNSSQLAGFAKRDDLRYFSRTICGIDYVHRPELAPTQALLDGYKKSRGSWEAFERQFVELITQRRIEHTTPRKLLDGACLLCSEDQPHNCHRRLIAEYLQRAWGDMQIVHL